MTSKFLRGAPRSLIFLSLMWATRALAADPAASAPLESTAPRFDIDRYEVQGNTLLKPEDVERIVQAFTGKQRDFGDIQQALEALELAYRSAGFSAVRVSLPEQELEKGTVRLRVIEARLKTITVEGNRYYDSANVRASLPRLREGTSPRTETVAAELRVANENPVKQTQVVLRSGAEEGEVDALVTVSDERPWKAFATLDNTGNAQTGRSRVAVGFQHANLFERDHVVTAQYQTSFEKPQSVHIYGFGYHLPWYDLGASMDFFGGYSDVNSGVVNNLFNVSGKGTVLGARYNQQLPRVDNYQQKLIYGIDYRAYQTAVIPVDGGTTLVPDYTVHPLSVTYTGQWEFPSAMADVNVTAVKHFPAGGKTDDATLNASRAGANSHYGLLRFGANLASRLGDDWQGRAALSGQATNEALVPGEQFGLGGAASVRGFQEREVSDDKGYRASLELYTPDFGARMGVDKAALRALAFYDLGRVWRNQPQPGEVDVNGIGSIGIGLRFLVGKETSFALDAARVLDGGGTRQRGDKMIHLSMSVSLR